MILTGPEIHRQVGRRDIIIDPFDPSQLNPNSYNYRLGPMIGEVEANVSEGSYQRPVKLCPIPSTGILLIPNKLYLSSTAEVIGSRKFVTSLIGRSSVGRLGLFLQLTADLGQLGRAHQWTLELACVQPIRIYAGMIIGQVSFWVPKGARSEYAGQYDTKSEPTGVLSHFFWSSLDDPDRD